MIQATPPDVIRVLRIGSVDGDGELLVDLIHAGIQYVPEVRLCHEAPTLSAAREWLADCSKDKLPHLIICDVDLPEPAGWACVASLHWHQLSAPVPIIMVSSLAPGMNGGDASADMPGVAGWIVKPLKRAAVQRAFFQVIRKHYLGRSNVLILTDQSGDATSLRGFLQHRGYRGCVLGAVQSTRGAMALLNPATQGIGCIVADVALLRREQGAGYPSVQQLFDYSKGAEIPLICMGSSKDHANWSYRANFPYHEVRNWGALLDCIDEAMRRTTIAT